MAALLTSEKGTTDKLVKYVNECREMGIRVLPPDASTSGLDFTVEGEGIRFGLSAIKNVGEAAIRSILEVRQRRARFASLPDLCSEVDLRLVNKRVLEALVQSGALDSLGERRSRLHASVDASIDYGQRKRSEREAGQTSLFGGGGDALDPEATRHLLPDLPDWDEKTRLGYEKGTLGFYVTGHPLESYRDLVRDFGTHTTASLREGAGGTEVAVLGIVAELKRRKSKKGSWWASMQIEDLEGLVEVMVFPKAYEACEKLLENERPVLVSGRLDVDEDRVRISADEVLPLDELRERRAESARLRLAAADLDEEFVARLRQTVEAHRGEVPLYLEVLRPGSYRLVARADPSLRIAPSRALQEALEAIAGPGALRYRARPARR
jgi:DNA polymerase-3 subunit alpha